MQHASLIASHQRPSTSPRVLTHAALDAAWARSRPLAQRWGMPGACLVCGLLQNHSLCLACKSTHASLMGEPGKPNTLQALTHAPARCMRCGLRTSGGDATHEGGCVACLLRHRRGNEGVGSDARALSSAHENALDRVVVAVDHAFPWASLVTRFKDHGRVDMARALAGCMLHAMVVDAAMRDGAPFDDHACVVPVPSSPARLRLRGYNPAWELARWLARWLPMRAASNLLQRPLQARDQRDLSRDERHAAVRHDFVVPWKHRAGLDQRHVVLVDDVMTTGATLAEAARVLKAVGAASVTAWVFARVPRVGDDDVGLS